MLAEETMPAAHAGEDQSSAAVDACAAHWDGVRAGLQQFWSKHHPECGESSLAALASKEQWLNAGDVVYVSEVRRHILTDADLNAAARATGGAQ